MLPCRVRGTIAALLAILALAPLPARGAITLNLDYVDSSSPEFVRFKTYVDRAMAGTPGFGFSAVDPVYMYKITGQPAYATFAIAMVEEQVADAEADIAAGRVPAVAHDSYLAVGDMIAELALVYDWCAPLLTPAQRTRWAAYAEQAVWNVWHHDRAQWGGRPAAWTGWSVDNPGNNYYYSFLEATMYWAMAGGSAQWRTLLDNDKLPRLVAYYAALPGGGSREGTGYGLAQKRLFALYRFWRDNTGTDLGAANAHLASTIDYWIHATVPTRDFVAPIGDQSRVSLPALYDYHRDLMLQARAASADATAIERAAWWLGRASVERMESGFNFRHDLLPAGGSAAPPSTLHHRSSGTGALFARSGWNDDAMWLSFIAGPYVESHAHQDQGSFTLYAGDWLAVTENVWTHSGIQQGGDVHNVVRFVANGRTIPQTFNSTSTMTVAPGAGGSLEATADLTAAYRRNPEVRSWHRSLSFLDRRIRLVDRFLVGNGVKAVFQLNTPVRPTFSGRTARAGNLVVEVVSPPDAILSALDWRTVNAQEFRRGWRIDVQGSGNEFVVDLYEAAATSVFANGFE